MRRQVKNSRNIWKFQIDRESRHTFSFDVFFSLFSPSFPSLIKGTRNRRQCLATSNTKTIGIRKEKEKKGGRRKKEEKEKASRCLSRRFMKSFFSPLNSSRRFHVDFHVTEKTTVAPLSLFLTRRKLFFSADSGATISLLNPNLLPRFETTNETIVTSTCEYRE